MFSNRRAAHTREGGCYNTYVKTNPSFLLKMQLCKTPKFQHAPCWFVPRSPLPEKEVDFVGEGVELRWPQQEGVCVCEQGGGVSGGGSLFLSHVADIIGQTWMEFCGGGLELNQEKPHPCPACITSSGTSLSIPAAPASTGAYITAPGLSGNPCNHPSQALTQGGIGRGSLSVIRKSLLDIFPHMEKKGC